jgi:hypothetical protein
VFFNDQVNKPLVWSSMEGHHKRLNAGHNPRDTLPSYISTLKAVWLGFIDSILGIGALFTHQERPSSKKQEDVALNRIYKCCLLNGGVFGVRPYFYL